MPINWVDGSAGGTPLSAANLAKLAVTADIGTPGTPTGDAARAAFDTVLTPSGTGDQTARVNAALAAVNPFGTKRRVALVGDFSISAPLVIGSRTTLDATNATITLTGGSSVHMLQNAAVTAARTVSDLATTAASATVTSATAAFTSGDVGAAVLIYLGDNSAPRHLTTTITSVTNATTVVLADAVPVTLAATGASIGPRDVDITIQGGRWIRGANGIPPGDNGLHSLFLRRTDRLTIRDLRFGSGTGKYGISLADVRDFEVDNFTLDNAPSDGVHLLGLCFYGVIRRVQGSTGDDLTAITCTDWTYYDDVRGDVSDIVFDQCRLTGLTSSGATPNAVALYGDDDGIYTIRRVTVRNCADLATAAQRTVRVTGNLIGLTVERCTGQVAISKGGAPSPTVSGVTIRDHIVNFKTGGPSECALITGTNVTDLTVDGLTVLNLPNSVFTFWHVTVQPGSTIDQLTVRRARRTCNRGGFVYAYGAGTVVNTIALEDCSSDGVDYNTDSRLVTVDTSGTVWSVVLRDCTLTRQGHAFNISQSQPCSVRTFGCDFQDSVNPAYVGGPGSVSVNSTGTLWGANGPSINNGGTLHSATFDLTVDVSKLAKTVGDMASNTSNANTGSLGVGPVVCIGGGTAPNWKSLVSGNTF